MLWTQVDGAGVRKLSRRGKMDCKRLRNVNLVKRWVKWHLVRGISMCSDLDKENGRARRVGGELKRFDCRYR